MSNDRIGRARPTAPADPSEASSSGTASPTAAPSRARAGEATAPSRSELLSRLRARRASAGAAASERPGRVATLPQRGAAAPSAQQRIVESVAAVDAADRHARRWQVQTALEGALDKATTLALADNVIAHLHRGLRALDDAYELGSEPPGGYEAVRGRLQRYMLQAAQSGLVALLDQLTQWHDTGVHIDTEPEPAGAPGRIDSSAAPDAPGPSRRPQGPSSAPSRADLIALGLGKLADARQRHGVYERIVDAFPAHQAQGGAYASFVDMARLSKIVARAAMRDINALCVELHVDRLDLAGTSIERIVDRMNARTIRALADVPVIQAAFDALDEAHALDPKTLADVKAIASAYLDGVDALSEQLCIETAALIETNDNPELWRCTLDTAAAFQTYGSYLRASLDEARPGAGAPAASTTSAADAAPALPATSAQGSRGASSSIAGQQAATAPVLLDDERTPATTTLPAHAPAHGAVSAQPAAAEDTASSQRPRVSYRALAQQANGDVIAFAHALGKDTGTLEQLRNPAFDPIESAHYARNAVQSWLGDMDNLRKSVRRAAANPARAEQLTDRLDALTTIHQHIATAESDALKALPCPKAKHLKRLLQLNGLEHVGAPIRLPSAGDVGNKGTLFEIAIRPRPLSSGEAARPLFLHLHTADLMDAAAAATVPFRKLTAAHVKTEAHRRLGARWEQMANALGSVHRGKIDAGVLGQLRAFGRNA